MNKNLRCSELTETSTKIKQRGLTILLLLPLLLTFPLSPSPHPVTLSTLANEPLSKLSEAEIARQLQNLPGWTVENQQLRRTYQFKDFVESVAFVNRLVEPAERAGHHPDITISYNKVIVSLTTHDAGGVTQKDLDLAQVISQMSASNQDSSR